MYLTVDMKLITHVYKGEGTITNGHIYQYKLISLLIHVSWNTYIFMHLDE